jgi:CheY-like chemotaxis protein
MPGRTLRERRRNFDKMRSGGRGRLREVFSIRHTFAMAALIPPVQPLVLVADDDALSRAMLGDVMRERGYDVVEATTGTQAIELIMANLTALQLVLLDLSMPDRDGFDVLSEVRTPAADHGIPIIVVTAMGAEQAKCAMDLGAVEAVMKGATPEEIGTLIDMAMSAAHAP